MGPSKPFGSPLDEHRLSDDAESEQLSDEQHAMYQSIVGQLMTIATRTRPDVTVLVSI